MRGDTVHHVYAVHPERTGDMHFGTFRTALEAEAEVGRLAARELGGRNWAAQHHPHGFVVRPGVVDTDFEIPTQPKPRDRYLVETTRTSPEGGWEQLRVDVFRRAGREATRERVASYERDLGLYDTFEPFRQGGRELALISRTYTRTAVLDLQSGEVIAEEDDDGFCPAGFYVPDWWDVHEGSVIPGSPSWGARYEWPAGDFGFVWGCIWGDDTSWKVQHLDLSRVQEGVIRRDDRFGYVELATTEHRPPWLDPDAELPSAPPPFIRVLPSAAGPKVQLAVAMDFELGSGKAKDWTRQKVGAWE
jgi:hypothetical protein